MNCFFLLKNTVVSYFACKTKGEFYKVHQEFLKNYTLFSISTLLR